MSTITREKIVAYLTHVADEASGKPLWETGRVSGLVVREGQVGFVLTVAASEAERYSALAAQMEQELSAMDGVGKVTIVLANAHGEAVAPAARAKAVKVETPVEGVKHIVAIASGKGGVGKSTTTVALALALRECGVKVGVLDADIYGPSIPLMLGADAQPEVENGKFRPVMAKHMPTMSMGYVLGKDAAIMRAPMITKALNQMFRQVAWGELDVLLVDMPPGTGDIALSLTQQVPLSGALLVTTPQQVAVADAAKAAQMFMKLHIPVLGVVENMSWLEQGGARLTPFGKGGGAELAAFAQAPLLGQVPLLQDMGAALDEGRLDKAPESYLSIAKQLLPYLS